MNIFYVSECPIQAALWLCDRHVIKMILETAQLLSTAHVVRDGHQVAYKATHVYHPSAIWVRESTENYQWAYRHLLALCEEYTYRYGKTHKTEMYLDVLSKAPNNVPDGSLTPIRLAMPDYLKSLYSGVQAYRMYYSIHKRVFDDGKVPTWTCRQQPEWF